MRFSSLILGNEKKMFLCTLESLVFFILKGEKQAPRFSFCIFDVSKLRVDGALSSKFHSVVND